MRKRNQEFANWRLPGLRDQLFLRRKLVWVLDIEGEKSLRTKIPQVDNRWKKVKDTPAIQFDLRKNWGNESG
jgi:hypothetical protein